MELERIRVDDHQSVAPFAFEDLVPSCDVALDPEARLGPRLGRLA